ncbi:MAG: MerR family transcriptional regulator [Chloroflexi bacterium]|nr:MerR family transcriptional regulator [Chloroflexota bacterium]
MFKIGEFSKIAQVSVSQLRYYDEIDLLKPASIDEWTGYRYYSARQLPRLNRILALKDLGMSLDQISRMLDDEVSVDEIRGMFSLKKAQAEQAVRDELARLRSIEARLQQLESGETADNYDIVVKSVPVQPFLALRKQCASFDVTRGLLLEIQRTLPQTVGIKNLGHLTVIMHNEGYTNTDVDLEMGFVLTGEFSGSISLQSGQQMALRTLSAVETMVTSVLVGPPDMSVSCRAVLATWVESNGYQFSGNGREVFIVPPIPGKEHETVLEIQYPVTKHQDTNLLPT